MLVVRKTKRYMIFLSLVLAFVVVLSTEARAEMFGFYNVPPPNNVADAAAGEAQLTVDVTDEGAGSVKFTFKNNIPDIEDDVPMYVAEVYFYDGKLNLEDIGGSTGVKFIDGSTSPAKLPGYDSGLLTTFLTVDSDIPGDPGAWGIDRGEYLEILFSYDLTGLNAYSYAEILSDIATSDLVLGIHVRGFEGGGSESFITPVPGAVILGILGLGVAGLKLRKYA